MALETVVSLALAATLTKTADLGVIPKDPLDFSRRVQLRTGTAAGQADKLWYDERTLAASATEDLDLVGVLVDTFGATVTLARVKALVVAAATTNTNNVVVGNATSNAWAGLLSATGTVTLRPGAFFAACVSEADGTGYAVTGGTGDLLKVANSAGGSTVTYQVIVVGASA
jgi:hypothetical protein